MTILHCTSDTHCHYPPFPRDIEGHILIHAGDFALDPMYVRDDLSTLMETFIRFRNWLEEAKKRFTHVLFCPGNHDFIFETFPDVVIPSLKELGVIVLNNQGIEIDGRYYYGSPNTPPFRGWAFERTDVWRQEIINAIPKKTNVLITHGPPYGILDKVPNGTRVGCPYLRQKVLEIEPEAHIFGHIHLHGSLNKMLGKTRCYNVAYLNEAYASEGRGFQEVILKD